MEGRKKQIIYEAVKLFSEHGYESTTINDIIKACDIARGTFYIYFKNKPDLLMSMNDMVMEELWLKMDVALQGKVTKEDVVSTCVDILFDYFGQRMDLLTICYVSGDRAYSQYIFDTLQNSLVPMIIDKLEQKDEITRHWAMMQAITIRSVVANTLLYAPEHQEIYKKLLKQN